MRRVSSARLRVSVARAAVLFAIFLVTTARPAVTVAATKVPMLPIAIQVVSCMVFIVADAGDITQVEARLSGSAPGRIR
jgi:hypothetical protein